MAANNYNAETAWNYLGTGAFDGRGAYDYSSVPKYQRIFSSLATTSNPRGRSRRTSSNMLDPLSVIEGYFSGLNVAPTSMLNNALAGKYLPIV